MGEGNTGWNCDWKLPGKENDGSKFKVPPDGSLKGSVIQVRVKVAAHQIVFKTSGDNPAERDCAYL